MGEIETQRQLTKRFIAADPTEIALVPRVQQKTNTGGIVGVDQSPRPVQTFKLIPMSHTERPFQSTSASAGTDAGVQRRYDFTLLGQWDAVVEENDWWQDVKGQRWRVDALVHGNDYETKALITSYGREP